MGMRQENDLRATEEAAVWLQRLRERDTPELRAEFSDWIRKGATNLEEFLFVQAIWKEMDHIDRDTRDRLWSEKSSAAVVDFPTHEPLRLESPQMEKRVRTWRRPLWAAAAALCGVLVLGWVLFAHGWLGSNVYATALGEQKSVKLSDGSVIFLNTRSRAVVDLTDKERVIRLTAGEALFTVAHDAKRPFYVLTDSARVRAIGTQFNVYLSGTNATKVTVIEGIVQVSDASSDAPANALQNAPATIQLKAGDEAAVDQGHVIKTAKPNIERAVSWRARKLMFPGNPVSEIVEQFNRYNKTPIRIEGQDLQARRMSGVFDADDPSPLLQYLAREPGVEVVYGSEETVIRLGTH